MTDSKLLSADEVSEQKPGRELDALVAAKVMGLICGKDWHDPCFDPQFCDQPLHSYSTSISAAWEVVEKLRRRCCCIEINSDHQYVWDVRMRIDRDGLHDRMDWDVWIKAEESLPYAICLAALEAVEGK